VHRVRIVVDTPIEVRRSDQVRSDDAGHTALLKLAGAIERQVSRHPQQWMMVEPVWCEDRHGMH
jgi:lauroyl/myristoyl acyltransferase